LKTLELNLLIFYVRGIGISIGCVLAAFVFAAVERNQESRVVWLNLAEAQTQRLLSAREDAVFFPPPDILPSDIAQPESFPPSWEIKITLLPDRKPRKN
jgi:hypothetical protein